MTIISMYRIDHRAIFLSDFRTSSNGNQTDVALKFINIGEHIGLFFSGDATFWERSVSPLQAVGEAVTINNVLEMEEPLCREIREIFWEQQPSIRSRAIGFVIDNETQENILFLIDARPRVGVSIEPIEENCCLVIGSGALIDNLESRISQRISHEIEENGEDLYHLANCMRQEIQSALNAYGTSSYRKLGISPYMALHSLAGSHFMIRGEQIEGEVFTEKGGFNYSYSFEKDEETGETVLLDTVNEQRIVISNIMNLENVLGGVPFDPQGLTNGFDPEEVFPDNEFVYRFHQWVVTDDKFFDPFVYRSITKISFVILDENTNLRVCKYSAPIIKAVDEPLENVDFYPDCRDQYFTVSNSREEEFVSDLNEENLFNHEWLSSFIDDYYSVFYTAQ
ncbi:MULTISPECIES: hypothetical protein [Bacillus cereus group]|uniref:Uncharacterized protein n=1 Tax=Bacillus thuringiensis TaxID=1428 RepID=A0AAW4HZF9_BACTU|nr:MULTISPECIES: hypothetical protein [Bacillus cereus group]ASZ69607.1 hypothetical protein CJ306_30775 [Bacillus cereus]MBN9901384.1 hypothetical protein [Bacillus thuringiensis]MCU7679064.1 hypothetical protein [Bacillus thuringiensis]MDY7519382.1 hypothetical protein [Bacillus thuringiensis]PFR36775.1 hypothetical protein COK20_17590 [Bacillus cereus]